MGRRCTLTPDQETDLCNIIQQMESRLYGLTPEAVCRIVFQFCSKNNINHNFNIEKQCAGRKWLNLFLSWHLGLYVRKPEETSIQRALGFNRSKVEIFYNVLKKLFSDDGLTSNIPADNIFNFDESGESSERDGS